MPCIDLEGGIIGEKQPQEGSTSVMQYSEKKVELINCQVRRAQSGPKLNILAFAQANTYTCQKSVLRGCSVGAYSEDMQILTLSFSQL